MIRLLLVEDDETISQMILDYFKETEEYQITLAKNADDALRYVNQVFDAEV